MTVFCKDCKHLHKVKKPWWDYWNEIIIKENCASIEARRPPTMDYVTGEITLGSMPPARHINNRGDCPYFEEK